VRPILENILPGDQLIEVRGFVARVPVPKRVMVGALNDRDGIDLDIPEVFDG
jgi:hypothetical protein